MNTILAPHHVLTENERVIVDVPDYFPKLVDLLAKTPKRYNIHRHPAFSINNTKF
jgi:hypothetical protein